MTPDPVQQAALKARCSGAHAIQVIGFSIAFEFSYLT
jgi:hypothetical protein